MPKSSTPTPAAKLRILLVDDNKNGLLARKFVLEEAGYDVTAFQKSEEALAAFQACPFDILVTDYRMPHMTGTELLARVREIRDKVPVVLVSSVAEVLGLTEQNTGADAVVPKGPHEIQNLLRTVNRLASKIMPRKPAASQAARRARKDAKGSS